jgi:hypothetical protein
MCLLDKIEQLRKVSPKKDTRTPLQKRASSKFITLKLMNKMCALNSPLNFAYKLTCRCSDTIKQVDGKMTSEYCGYRWCLLCNRIRTAQYIGKYEPILKEWKDTQFVTLTIVSIGADDLLSALNEMNKNFRRILDLMRKREISIRGIRKLEITYNEKDNTYHPHFHVLVEGRVQAEMLHSEWLRLYPTSKNWAQDIQRVRTDKVDVYKEIFKYVTKLFDKDAKTGKYKEINPVALDVIFRALKKKRIMQPFGFVAPEIAEEGKIELTESTDAPTDEIKTYVWVGNDWWDMKTWEALTNFCPSNEVMRMLKETNLVPT